MTAESSPHRYGPSFAQSRTKARRAALQAIYQWQIGQQPLREIEAWFLAEQDLRGADIDYFRELIHQIPHHLDSVDQAILSSTKRGMSDLDIVELTALRIGVYELLYRPDIPYRVVIDEVIELVKRFGAEKGHLFVNGVIDQLAHQCRPSEMRE